jgi:predicted ATP-dependent serine protease
MTGATNFLKAIEKLLGDHMLMFSCQLSQMQTFITMKNRFGKTGELQCVILHTKCSAFFAMLFS